MWRSMPTISPSRYRPNKEPSLVRGKGQAVYGQKAYGVGLVHFSQAITSQT